MATPLCLFAEQDPLQPKAAALPSVWCFSCPFPRFGPFPASIWSGLFQTTIPQLPSVVPMSSEPLSAVLAHSVVLILLCVSQSPLAGAPSSARVPQQGELSAIPSQPGCPCCAMCPCPAELSLLQPSDPAWLLARGVPEPSHWWLCPGSGWEMKESPWPSLGVVAAARSSLGLCTSNANTHICFSYHTALPGELQSAAGSWEQQESLLLSLPGLSPALN